MPHAIFSTKSGKYFSGIYIIEFKRMTVSKFTRDHRVAPPTTLQNFTKRYLLQKRSLLKKKALLTKKSPSTKSSLPNDKDSTLRSSWQI